MSRKWISFPIREGESSRQAHCDFPQGTYEREMGREGFFGPASHLHHKHPPTGWIDWEGPLRPHAFNFNHIPSEGDCPLRWRCTTPTSSCACGRPTAPCATGAQR